MDHGTYTKKLAAQGPPAHVLYFFMFSDLVAADQVASKQEAKGEGPGSYRTVFSREAGLTDDEGATLNQVALDWKQQNDAIEVRKQTILDSRRAEPNPPKNLLTGAEFSQYGKDVIANIDEHIDELKSQLGEDSFTKLDTYVKARYHPSIAQPGHLPKRPFSAVTPSNGGVG